MYLDSRGTSNLGSASPALCITDSRGTQAFAQLRLWDEEMSYHPRIFSRVPYPANGGLRTRSVLRTVHGSQGQNILFLSFTPLWSWPHRISSGPKHSACLVPYVEKEILCGLESVPSLGRPVVTLRRRWTAGRDRGRPAEHSLNKSVPPCHSVSLGNL